MGCKVHQPSHSLSQPSMLRVYITATVLTLQLLNDTYRTPYIYCLLCPIALRSQSWGYFYTSTMTFSDTLDHQVNSGPVSSQQLETNQDPRHDRRQRHLEQTQGDTSFRNNRYPRRKCFLSYTAWIASILAPVTYLAGVIAQEDGTWRTAFFMYVIVLA